MVKDISNRPGGWSKNTQDLEVACQEEWDRISLDSIRGLMLGYRQRLMCIHSRGGDRQPQFA